MTDHRQLAEAATATAQAHLDPEHPDPAELALLAGTHWLGAIYRVLADAFNPAADTSAAAWHDGYAAGRDDEAQGLPLRPLAAAEQDPLEHDGDPTVVHDRPDLDRHHREAALLRDHT